MGEKSADGAVVMLIRVEDGGLPLEARKVSLVLGELWFPLLVTVNVFPRTGAHVG